MSTFNHFNRTKSSLSQTPTSIYYEWAKKFVETDEKLATFYYEKAWKQDNCLLSAFALAKAFEQGKGVIQNIKRAEEIRNEIRDLRKERLKF